MMKSVNSMQGVVSSPCEAVLASIPDTGIEFGYCGVNQTVTRSFVLHNPSSQQVRFNIQSQEQSLFNVSVTQGTLGPKQKKEVHISFTTTEAKVIIASIVVRVIATGPSAAVESPAAELTKVLKMSAIGKFPFVTLDNLAFDFENLLIGKTASQVFNLQNSSLVPTNYTIERVNDDGKDKAIKVDHTSGELLPGQITKVTVTYTPSLAGVKSYCLLKVSAFGGNDIEFSCRGEADGYNVELSSKTVHFGEVQALQTTNRLLNVVNDSDLPTSFQFFTDKSNLFSISMTEGIVKPHASQRIIITFSPQRTGNYYERIFCLVKNHKVLYVDLLGTCYDVLTKPVPLSQRHIDTYRHKVIMGAHRKVQSVLKDMEAAAEDSLMDSGLDVDLHLEIPIDDPNQVILHKEMLHSSSAQTRDLRLSDESVNFAFTENGRISESRQLTLENKFGFPIAVDWTLLPVLNRTTGQMVKNPFKVLPAQKEIGPNSVHVFNVDFAPYEPDSYFFQIAQCFVTLQNGNHEKMKQLTGSGQTMGAMGPGGSASLRSQKASTKGGAGKTLLGTAKQAKYSDWTHEEIDPPLCLSARLSGHSFAPGSQPFIPMVKMSTNKIAFPPCSPNESVYQTIQLNNTSDTPVQYSILQDTTGTFKSFPPIGQISGKSFTLICLEFNPKSPRFYNFSAQFLFNNSSANMQQVLLQGFCYGPQVTLSSQQLFFPPSYVGVSTRQKFPLRNESRIPVEYEWRVPDKYRNEISFEPVRAILQPNEASQVQAVFTPLKRKEYQVSIPLFTKNLFDQLKNTVGFFAPGSGLNLTQVNAAQSQISTMQQAQSSSKFIEIVGAGADGMIAISPANLDFGTITVGYTKTLSVTITNKANCNLYIELKMMQTQRDESGDSNNVQRILNSCFKFDNHKGIVNAKSKKKVNITFKPSLRFQFETSLVCIATEKMTKDLSASIKLQTAQGMIKKPLQGHVEKAQIKIHCKGDYPLLRFTDVRNDQVSIANLWERFELTKMNKELLHPLNQAEQDFNNSDQINGSNEDLIANLQGFSWDFGKLPIKNGSKPRKITLSLKNVGGVQADWHFKMPNDSEIQMESWADPGTPSQEQAFEKEILDKQIFEIEPRRGSLAPGEQMDLHVLYYPKEVRKHHLSIFFQILNGKPLSVRFEGETLHRRAQLQLIKHTYDLPPVPIGLEWAITYPIEIKNLGITKLKYQIDMSRMEKLNQDNHDFRVFEIQNPEGTLRSNEISHIFTLFRPLEAKKYALDLPIKISDIEGPSVEPYTLRLRGTGYHLEQEKPDEVQFYEDLPVCRAHLNDDGSMAAFSTESIDFGDISHDEPSRRFVILYNLNPTQKLKFDFQKTRLICGDELFLEPMSGELKPNSHCNIKMTLLPGKYPCNFEGEIQCSIDWENEDRRALDEARSVATNTNVPEVSEYLFIRLKKRAMITKMHLGADLREGESLIENIVNEAMHDILESDEFDRLLDESNKAKAGIYERAITDEAAPAEEDLVIAEERKGNSQAEGVSSNSRHGEAYEEQLMEVSGVNSEELFRKRMYMQKPFVDLMEFILEDTLFNLMEEATYDEFDLGQPPRIYIRKDE